MQKLLPDPLIIGEHQGPCQLTQSLSPVFNKLRGAVAFNARHLIVDEPCRACGLLRRMVFRASRAGLQISSPCQSFFKSTDVNIRHA